MSSKYRRIYLPSLFAAAAIAAAAGYFYLRGSRLPAPGSEQYVQATRAFYRGLASLDVGLLDDAKREFTDVTTRVPEEPAAWANLGLSHLRLGELDAAAAPIERARMLAPENAELELLAGRMEISRGRLDEGLAHVRRAVDLAPGALEPRFALAEELENAATSDADTQALALLDELTKQAPQNLALMAERARLAAKVQDRARVVESLDRLKPFATGWPADAAAEYASLQKAVASGDMAAMPLATTSLRNVLLRVAAYREDLAAIRTPAELISEPLRTFIALTPPVSQPASPDLELTFRAEPIGAGPSSNVPELLLALPHSEGKQPAVFQVELSPGRVMPLTGQRVQAAGPARFATDVGGNPRIAVAADWNNDFRPDIITAALGGVRLLLQQDDGSFVEQTPQDPMAAACVCVAVWAADVEMDGDIDVIASSDSNDPPFVLRNNGDGSWTGERLFTGLMTAVDMVWADLDDDGDPDAAFLEREGVRAFANRQAGDFAALPELPVTSPTALTVADLDADGLFELVVLERSGAIKASTLRGGSWSVRDVAQWDHDYRGPARLIADDFDNNGALDLLATTYTASQLWLGDSTRQLQRLERPIAGAVFPSGDLNADGRLDLLAIVATDSTLPAAGPDQPPIPNPPSQWQVVRLLNSGTKTYHWKEIRARAQETAGDQRVNSFGVGGYVEARAGLLFQKQLLTGGPLHIGLGTETGIDVARIVWPNGVPQAEFDVNVDNVIVVEQRLKGSCPWVFTWDGTRMTFVTDFLWRSPLGLRINAQDTAGVTQTEDWVRLRGDQLVPRNGRYDVRITAELWETHFFDHVSLMAVDHPDGTEVFVDERFSPASPPAYRVHAVKDLQPVATARDHRGADVTATVAARDGQYLSTFSRGRYQGIAEEHFVEIGLDGRRADVLIATGWIYPTDSSINVAIAQAGIAPRGLSLEARNADGSWRVVHPDLGFPAGKHKTLVIDLGGIGSAQLIRLRTNLEIYWDALQLGTRADSPVRTTRIAASAADLGYRGFSHTVSPRGSAPETPEYDRIASTSPRWRDLEGYHTRFGDVRELVERVDDRYVIMNAGDELRLQFPEAPAVAQGWRRDFVLIGDGWEKDGDYNTGFSQTVLPLPSHDRPDYGAGTTSLALEDDPVYQRHRSDWQRFHTRYVAPERFLKALRPARVN